MVTLNAQSSYEQREGLTVSKRHGSDIVSPFCSDLKICCSEFDKTQFNLTKKLSKTILAQKTKVREHV